MAAGSNRVCPGYTGSITGCRRRRQETFEGFRFCPVVTTTLKQPGLTIPACRFRFIAFDVTLAACQASEKSACRWCEHWSGIPVSGLVVRSPLTNCIVCHGPGVDSDGGSHDAEKKGMEVSSQIGILALKDRIQICFFDGQGQQKYVGLRPSSSGRIR